MSWISDNSFSWYEKLAVNITKAGPVPCHVAFIMDGNRRFASKLNRKKSDGHSMGFDKLSEVLQWCLMIGIKEVTVYAFSIENFKRSDDEVDTLMNLAKEKFDRLLEEQDKLTEKGIRINVIGNIGLLPKEIQKLLADAVLMTKDNTKVTLNVAFSYTSRDEITHSIQQIVEGVETGDIEPNDINTDLINTCLYSKGGRDPDLLLRTSGETRLSDFLLWQTTSTVVYFTEALWPEFTLWHLLGAVFLYQRNVIRMHIVKKILDNGKEPVRDPNKINKFFKKIENNNHTRLLKLSKTVND